jgi:hypothetical protein
MVMIPKDDIPKYNRLAVWRDKAQVAYMAPGGIPITKDLLMLDSSGWPVENPAAVAAAKAAKAGPSSSASASIGTDTGVPDPTAKVAVLNTDGSLYKTYEWGSRRLKELMRDKIVQVGSDGRLYRRSADEINAERAALASAVAADSAKAGPSSVLSGAETAVVPAGSTPLTDEDIEAILSGEGRGKRRSEIQAVGFPADEWTPAQARKWLKAHGAVPIKGMRREGTWLRWRITPPNLYRSYTTKTLRSNGKAIHLVLGWP